MKRSQRTPKNYDGTRLTSRHVADLLPKVLCSIGSRYKESPELILAAWPEIIGQKLAPMTEAVAFTDGVLFVKVKNSTLHSLLNQHDRARILNNLRSKFPTVSFKNIVFRIG